MKLFIFDMGGVVTHNKVSIIPAIAGELGISGDDFFRGAGADPAVTHTSPYNTGDLAALQRGDIGSKIFWENFSRRTGIKITGDPWAKYFKPEKDEGTYSVIRDLKKAGYRVVCGTNTMEAHFRIHTEQGDYAPFDKVYASDTMKIIKPDPAFWTYILDKEKTGAGNAFFTDDTEENVLAAEKLGLGAHHFKNSKGLREAVGKYL